MTSSRSFPFQIGISLQPPIFPPLPGCCGGNFPLPSNRQSSFQTVIRKSPMKPLANECATNSPHTESNGISSPLPLASIPDDWEWDQPLSDQDLQAIDAVEAAFQSASSSSSAINKRPSSPPNDDHHQDSTRRKLPASILGLFSQPLSLSPCQASVKMRYSALKFGGRILYSRTAAEVEKAAKELLRRVEPKRAEANQVFLGFDIEWKATFRRGVPPGKVAVMQICVDHSHCHVMHILHSGITRTLQLILEDPTLVKVGAGIGGDCRKVFKDYNVSVKSAEDLSFLANQKLGGQPRVWGLQSLSESLICKELSKPSKIRRGNWEVYPLSNEQLEYAATDAFASLHLHEVLKSLPDAKPDVETSSEEQSRPHE